MKTSMVLVMVGLVMSAYGADKKPESKDKRPKPIDVVVANTKPTETPKSPSDTTEVPKKESDERSDLYSHTATKITWGAVKKHQDKV